MRKEKEKKTQFVLEFPTCNKHSPPSGGDGQNTTKDTGLGPASNSTPDVSKNWTASFTLSRRSLFQEPIKNKRRSQSEKMKVQGHRQQPRMLTKRPSVVYYETGCFFGWRIIKEGEK
jgi:hypothetical protein